MKKKLALVLFLLFARYSYSQCDGAPGTYRINPDGSPGGFVASTALVAVQAYTDSSVSVCDKAIVLGETSIRGLSLIKDNAFVGDYSIVENSTISGGATIRDFALIKNAIIKDRVIVGEYAMILAVEIFENAQIYGEALIQCGHPQIFGSAQVFESATIQNDAKISGAAQVYGGAVVNGIVEQRAQVFGTAVIGASVVVSGDETISTNIIRVSNE